ncbi:MAG: 5-bromo-4-chloroindolyl phosphate hydrolysis family protein [Exiguobacterium profundum]|nr:MAG: 5-bromo-4-chloroindolyl phosphate hydrolysis family protein [Exiguobacterium profundum]
MAQRYGGKYSPGVQPKPGETGSSPGSRPQAPNIYDGRRPAASRGRTNVLFLAPLPFVIAAFTGDSRHLILGLSSAAILTLATWLTREGIVAQEAYDARTVARRPAIPRKIFGAVLTGAALGLGATLWQDGLIYPALIGLLGAALHLGAFGPDPLRDKGMEGIDSFQTDRVARAVDEAEKHIAAMKDAILRAKDKALEARVDRFAATARQLFRSIESDPGDLTAARKYLSVYLMGARDATVKFADHYARSRDASARADYEALLTDLETTFAYRTQALLSNDRTDLDVEISVLRDRLKREF